MGGQGLRRERLVLVGKGERVEWKGAKGVKSEPSCMF